MDPRVAWASRARTQSNNAESRICNECSMHSVANPYIEQVLALWPSKPVEPKTGLSKSFHQFSRAENDNKLQKVANWSPALKNANLLNGILFSLKTLWPCGWRVQLPVPVRSPAKTRACSPGWTHVKYASRFFRQESQTQHAVSDEM